MESSATIRFYNQGSGINCLVENTLNMSPGQWFMPATPIQMAALSGSANQIFAWVGYSGQAPIQNWSSSICLPTVGWVPPSIITDQSAYWFKSNQSEFYRLQYNWSYSGQYPDILPGWNMVSFNNPITTRISSVISGQNGDQVFVWQGSGWGSATFLSGLGWLGDPEILPMQGIWLRRI